MKVKFEVIPHLLKFRFEAGTSRGSFTEKETWFIKAWELGAEDVVGWGEASPLKGLSIDYSENYAIKLRAVLDHIEGLDVPKEDILNFISENTPFDMPSLRFGVETALLDLISGGKKVIFQSPFVKGNQRIPINGLVWMGEESFMRQQIEEKIEQGFDTIKMKIGAIDWETELAILSEIRDRYRPGDFTLRVDANGAFDESNVRDRLTELASLDIHSIEQPIKLGQPQLMAELCKEEILPIALDEELIGIDQLEDKRALLENIKPQFIILKPSLIGGVLATQEWIEIAESLNTGWWMTSMLEANIGLNAIAQLTASYNPSLPQGLGTGQLYQNNIDSPLEIRKGELVYNVPKGWSSVN